jgi:hypothetical protein
LALDSRPDRKLLEIDACSVRALIRLSFLTERRIRPMNLLNPGVLLLLYVLRSPANLEPGDCDGEDWNSSGVAECLDDDGETEVYRVEA